MIVFGPFRTLRITAELQELTIGQAMELHAMPESRHEAATTMLLNMIVKQPDRIGQGQVTDPRLWTVQERGAVVASYLGHITNTPNFAIGDITYDQYLMAGEQTVQSISAGTVAEDEWTLHPLLGYQAECIERVIDMERATGGSRGWILGAMAFQMRLPAEKESEFLREIKLPDVPLEDLIDAHLDEWLVARLVVLKRFPESEFSSLLDAYFYAGNQAKHLLRVGFNDQGVVFLTEVPSLPSARFPVSDVFSSGTAEFLGVAPVHADEPDPVQPPAAQRGDEHDAE